tara:strand:- start:17998 stop:18282 length:285 start_codon:yes stop_codon:yes gene_type:complete
MSGNIKVEVAYATPALQKIVVVQVPVGVSIFDVACESGIEQFFPEIDFEKIDMGVFGKVVKKPKEQKIREGERVELYRPLIIDPKQARLNRAAK